jgi:O-antigen/teichoic acid export membrane protein
LVRIFLPAIVLYGAYPLVSTYLLRVKRTRLVVGGNVFALVANVVATAVLVPAHGAIGASVALVGALLLNVLVVGAGAARARARGNGAGG